MAKPQQSLERQHERLEQETHEGLSDNFPDPDDPNDTDVDVQISLPMSQAALIDVLGLFQSGTLTAAVTVREE